MSSIVAIILKTATLLFQLQIARLEYLIIKINLFAQYRVHHFSIFKATLNSPIGHESRINDITFAHTHPDVLFSCSSDGTIRVWDIRGEKPGPVYRGKEFFSFGISPQDQYLASGSENSVFVWDIKSTKMCQKLEDFHSEEITQVFVSLF
jgi:WD40 repeat protein